MVFAVDRIQRRRVISKERSAAAIKEAELRAQVAEAENARKTKELEEARQLQLSMLPKKIPELSHLDIAVYMKTATEVGGDYYDFSIKADGSLNVAIGDATGHGMKAGTMVSSMKSIFTTNSPTMEIDTFFTTANEGIKSMNLDRLMMGFTLLNINGNAFKVVNAGMPPVLVYRRQIATVEEIQNHSMPIGAMKTSSFETQRGFFREGDVILLLSDGMPELINSNNEMYGYKRINILFKKNAHKEAKEIVETFEKECSTWADNDEIDDDVTFVIIKAKGLV